MCQSASVQMAQIRNDTLVFISLKLLQENLLQKYSTEQGRHLTDYVSNRGLQGHSHRQKCSTKILDYKTQGHSNN